MGATEAATFGLGVAIEAERLEVVDGENRPVNQANPNPRSSPATIKPTNFKFFRISSISRPSAASLATQQLGWALPVIRQVSLLAHFSLVLLQKAGRRRLIQAAGPANHTKDLDQVRRLVIVGLRTG